VIEVLYTHTSLMRIQIRRFIKTQADADDVTLMPCGEVEYRAIIVKNIIGQADNNCQILFNRETHSRFIQACQTLMGWWSQKIQMDGLLPVVNVKNLLHSSCSTSNFQFLSLCIYHYLFPSLLWCFPCIFFISVSFIAPCFSFLAILCFYL